MLVFCISFPGLSPDSVGIPDEDDSSSSIGLAQRETVEYCSDLGRAVIGWRCDVRGFVQVKR